MSQFLRPRTRLARPPWQFQPGNRKSVGRASAPRRPGKTLLEGVREALCKVTSRNPDGTYNTEFDAAVNAFVQQLKNGSFVHTKEYIDREEGKVPTRVANADGSNLKPYIGLPVDGPSAP